MDNIIHKYIVDTEIDFDFLFQLEAALDLADIIVVLVELEYIATKNFKYFILNFLVTK